MLAVLRWAENPLDRGTAFRVLQLLPGIGPGIAGRILDGLASRTPLQQLSLFRPPARAADDWPAFTTLMQRLCTKAAEWPAEMDLVRDWLSPYLEQRYADALVRVGDLDQLAKIAAGYASRRD